jgi:hypothetical protein
MDLHETHATCAQNKQRLKPSQFLKESNAEKKTERSGIKNGGRSTTSGIGEAQKPPLEVAMAWWSSISDL